MLPHGTYVLPHGTNVLPHGANVLPHGTYMLPHGANVLPHGANVLPHGTYMLPHGTNVLPHGANVLPHGTYMLPHGIVCQCKNSNENCTCVLGYFVFNNVLIADLAVCLLLNRLQRVMTTIFAHFVARPRIMRHYSEGFIFVFGKNFSCAASSNSTAPYFFEYLLLVFPYLWCSCLSVSKK